jgi:hypothetical protein
MMANTAKAFFIFKYRIVNVLAQPMKLLLKKHLQSLTRRLEDWQAVRTHPNNISTIHL